MLKIEIMLKKYDVSGKHFIKYFKDYLLMSQFKQY